MSFGYRESSDQTMSFMKPYISLIGDLTADSYVNSRTVKLGGAALNSAMWSKRNGARVSVVSAVGNDAAGNKFIKKFRAEKLSCDGIQQKRGSTSGIEIFISESGERRYGSWNPGVLTTYHLRQQDYRILQKSDAVVITVYPPYLHILDECMKLKRDTLMKHRPLFVINYGDLNEFNHSFDVPKQFLDLADILIFGLDKDRDEDLINEVRQCALVEKKFALVTLGKYGSIAWDGKTAYVQSAQEVTVRDTTGAGDSFLAGFLITFLKTRNIQQSLQQGTDLASRAIQKLGAY